MTDATVPVPKVPAFAWVLLAVAVALFALEVYLMTRNATPRKPCHGCSDADLGLVLDEPNHSEVPK